MTWMEARVDLSYGSEALEGFPVEELALFVLEREKAPANAEVSVSFVSNEEMAQLNEQYRGKKGPTDVLSFECDGEGVDFAELEVEAWSMEESFALGDVVIAVDVARVQAEEYGTSFEDEVSLLLVHGLLHLCGYDHIEDDEAVCMQAREKEHLKAWQDGSSAGGFVRNDEDKGQGASLPIMDAFRFAAQGFAYTFKTQRNMKVYLAFALAALALAAALGLGLTQWAIIIGCIAAVFSLECANTAVESLVDLCSPEYARLAKIAKDCSAAAVLVVSIASLAIACLLFAPALISLIL